MATKNFFAELKRRNVYKVAVAYAVVAWLLIQAASILFPTFEAPAWVMKVFATAIILGFPVALILAWAFELTPQGIKRAEDVLPKESITRKTGRRLVAITVALAVIAASLLAFQFLHPKLATKAAPARIPAAAAPVIAAKSIAVLPFENLSEDKTNAYFAEGIQEEILTRLAKIADLKVISRMSTHQYQSKPGNLSEIAKQLGVANILEGSVQKAADQVRVNVQLINAQNDSHLWADTYDRKLTDVFGVESEIAKSIAESLQAKLTGREEQALAVKTTNNPQAYDAYLRGLAAEEQWLHSLYAMEKAIGFYERAVQLDPNFAVAWSRLSRADSDLYSLPNDPTSNRREAAKRALDMAQKLQPNSPETLLALADYQLVVLRDYELAKTTYRLISTMLPGSSEVPASLAAIARRQGHWDDAIAYYEQALVLDPRNTLLLVDAAWNDADLRNFEGARKLYDRALDISPNDLDLMAQKASIYQGEGNLEEAARLLREVNAQTPSVVVFAIKITQLTLERNLSEALRLLRERVAQFHFGSELEKGVFTTSLALTQRLAGDNAGAKITAEQARNTLGPLCKNQPENDFAAIWLSRAYAVLGDKNSALNEAQRAIALRPSAYSAAYAPGNEENLALIRTIIGENSGAISTLTRLLEVPYQTTIYSTPITPALLRLDPTWDPLRADPAFQKLCQEKRR